MASMNYFLNNKYFCFHAKNSAFPYSPLKTCLRWGRDEQLSLFRTILIINTQQPSHALEAWNYTSFFFVTLPEHLSSSPVFSGVRVTRSLVLYVCFVDCCLSFCTFYFGHCVVCSPLIYGFWLPLWYLQSLQFTYISLLIHHFFLY